MILNWTCRSSCTSQSGSSRVKPSLLAGRVPHSRENLEARLERALDELPDRVQAYLEDLETLLAQHQVSGRRKGSSLLWLGEEDSNPR